MADALEYWRDETVPDSRSRLDAALWRPLLAEGLIGSGQADRAAAVLGQLRGGDQAGYLQPALAWLDGWLAERQGAPDQAREIYQHGEIAAELFISRKAVEYHLGNIYAKCGLRGRQELRRFVEQWRQPAAV